MASADNRVVCFICMDVFFVEERGCPSLRGEPASVVQFRTYNGGGIIAVNHVTKHEGVKRGMFAVDTTDICPDIRGKADLTKHREASAEVLAIITSRFKDVERDSIDEAYIDITKAVDDRIRNLKTPCDQALFCCASLPNTWIVGPNDTEKSLIFDHFVAHVSDCSFLEDYSATDIRLAIGAQLVENLRAEIYEKTEFRCSAGIAHNKILAKLACGLNKPNKQTIFSHNAAESFLSTLPVHKLKNLGGKLGSMVKRKSDRGYEFVGDVRKFSHSSRMGERSIASFATVETPQICKKRKLERNSERKEALVLESPDSTSMPITLAYNDPQDDDAEIIPETPPGTYGL